MAFLHTPHQDRTTDNVCIKSILLSILLSILAAFLGCEDSSPKLPRLSPQATVLAFGDSLTFGTGASEEESYPAQLARIIGKKVVRAGVPGEVSAQGLKRLPEELDRHRPSLIILCHGGNDIIRRVDKKQIAANITKMIQMAQQRGISVVLVGVPHLGFALSITPAEFYETIASEKGIPYEENTLTELLNLRKYKSDSIHLNAAGYRKLAEAIAELLRHSGAVS